MNSYEAKYCEAAVDQMIAKDKRIKGKEARLIRALLKGPCYRAPAEKEG